MGNFHVKPKMDAPVPAPPPAPKAKVSNTQAGAVAWRWLWADGSRASEWFDGLPTEAAIRNGAEKGAHVEYLTPPAVVPVEDLVKLVERMTDAAGKTDDHMFESATLSWRSELTQLIKERSNG